MSLATRCTHCGTIFRVVQDQLKVSEGWVRCGRCHEVFSALEGLFDLEREAPPQRAGARPGSPDDAPAHDADAATSDAVHAATDFDPFDHGTGAPGAHAAVASTSEADAVESRFLMQRGAEPDASPHAGLRSHDIEMAPGAAQVDALPFDGPFDGPIAHDSHHEPVSAPPLEPEPVPETTDAGAAPPSPSEGGMLGRWRANRDMRDAALASSILEPSLDDAASTKTEDTDLAVVRSSYLNPDAPPGVWQRPWVKSGLGVGAGVLMVVLLLQIAHQYRDAFATQWPQSRAALEQLCDWTGCRIEPLRRLAAVTVEDSGLTQVQGSEAYRLSVTLHNRSSFEVAMPSIDLSLTDGSGGLVSRRAMAPTEFSGAPKLAAGATMVTLPPGGEAQLQALLASRGARLSGYTVELFYP